MEKLLNYLLTNITDHPDEVRIQISESEKEIAVRFSVHPDDIGRVIGKQGRTINAIRTLGKVLAMKEKKHLVLTLDEEQTPPPASVTPTPALRRK